MGSPSWGCWVQADRGSAGLSDLGPMNHGMTGWHTTRGFGERPICFALALCAPFATMGPTTNFYDTETGPISSFTNTMHYLRDYRHAPRRATRKTDKHKRQGLSLGSATTPFRREWLLGGRPRRLSCTTQVTGLVELGYVSAATGSSVLPFVVAT